MSKGIVNVSRCLWDDEVFRNEPFTEREAWIWMIAEAAWKSREKRVGGVIVTLQRGQLAHSTRFLSGAWGWSHSRVRRFLDRLENRHMTQRKTDTGVTVICIMKYDTYQNKPSKTGTAPAQQQTQNRHSTGTNENKGINKEGNKKIGELLCQVVKSETAADFIDHRKALKKPLTEAAARRIVAKLKDHHDPDGVLDKSIENGWQGIFPEKVEKPKAGKKEPWEMWL